MPLYFFLLGGEDLGLERRRLRSVVKHGNSAAVSFWMTLGEGGMEVAGTGPRGPGNEHTWKMLGENHSFIVCFFENSSQSC